MDQKSSFVICPRVSARFLHCFCTPAGKPCFSLHCLHSVHRGGTCRGEAPPSCWRKTVLLLKSLTGAFIAALRSQTRIFPYFFQANSRRVNSRRWSGFICRTTFSIPSGVIWMLSGRFSFTGTRKSCLEHMWVADMEFAVAPEIVDSSPPKSPFSLHRNRITLLIEILLDLKPNVNFCEKMSRVFQTKTAYITNDAGGFLGGVKRKSKKC